MSVASSRAGKCQLRAVEVASRLSTAMTQWQRFGSERQSAATFGTDRGQLNQLVRELLCCSDFLVALPDLAPTSSCEKL